MNNTPYKVVLGRKPKFEIVLFFLAHGWADLPHAQLILVSRCTYSKTQLVTKLKKSNCDKTQKFKLGQISKTQIVTKLKL